MTAPIEVIFEVIEFDDGGFEARALGHSIFTQGEDWSELKEMAREAVLCHFDEAETPRVIRLHLVRDEVIRESLCRVRPRPAWMCCDWAN